ncbi:hypothetical protein D3C80_822830 [compost metagenome]
MAQNHCLFRKHPEFVGRGRLFGNEIAQFVIQFSQHHRDNGFAYGLLGLEESVDVGRGDTDRLGQVRDGRLAVAILAKVFVCHAQDLKPAVMVHGASLTRGWQFDVAGSGRLVHGGNAPLTKR